MSGGSAKGKGQLSFLLAVPDEVVVAAWVWPDAPTLDRGSHGEGRLDQIEQTLDRGSGPTDIRLAWRGGVTKGAAVLVLLQWQAWITFGSSS